LDNITVNKIY